MQEKKQSSLTTGGGGKGGGFGGGGLACKWRTMSHVRICVHFQVYLSMQGRRAAGLLNIVCQINSLTNHQAISFAFSPVLTCHGFGWKGIELTTGGGEGGGGLAWKAPGIAQSTVRLATVFAFFCVRIARDVLPPVEGTAGANFPAAMLQVSGRVRFCNG